MGVQVPLLARTKTLNLFERFGVFAFWPARWDVFSRQWLHSQNVALEFTATCHSVLLAADRSVAALYADSGVKDVNGAVDAALFSACLDRLSARPRTTTMAQTT
jgi:hypothetical protein